MKSRKSRHQESETVVRGACTYVRMLRKKIEKVPAMPEYILNEPWIGYRFRNPYDRNLPRWFPCEDLQRLCNLLPALRWLCQRSRHRYTFLIPNKSSDAVAADRGPFHRGRTIDRPYQPDVGSVDRNAEESEIKTPGVGNPRGKELSRRMLRHRKSLRTRTSGFRQELGSRLP